LTKISDHGEFNNNKWFINLATYTHKFKAVWYLSNKICT
jgi:hypothetical protein